MKKYILQTFLASTALLSFAGCIKEIDPMSSNVTEAQVAAAPGSFDGLVGGLTSGLCGEFTYSGSNQRPFDFGYPTFYIMRDIMGQDMVAAPLDNEWYETWYTSGTALGPQYAYCQVPMTYYYGWIKDCNNVIDMAGENIPEDKKTGVGIAYAMRALFYEDVARMYNQKSYAVDKDALSTVLQVTQSWNPYHVSDLTHNRQATNEVMWNFILSDLDKAEELLADYKRADKYTPDRSVVYGLKARAYLEMCDWANAERYAKLAQNGYNIMTAAEYTDRDKGFNTPNNSWMMGLTYKDNDPNIMENDGDSSWGSQMIIEIDPKVSGCGYASNYNGAKSIDKHLYSTIPASDCRKKCFVDFAIDDLPTKEDMVEALKDYSKYPEWVYSTGYELNGSSVGGISLKFRAAGGDAGHKNQYVGFCVAVPMMRVEEMYLIEAEAVGMQAGREEEGKTLLTNFATTRDPNYTYGTHNEAYGNPSTPAFQNEVWWQRRVEFWGEGLAMYDIKRLNKSVIRSYPGTNHWEEYRWNTEGPAQWMTYCFVQTESNYNFSLVQNPTPVAPKGDSPEAASF